MLSSSSVLALDLARHPSGAAVADTVDRVLCLTRDDLDALAAATVASPARDEARVRVLEHCACAPRMSAMMQVVGDTVAEALPGPEQARLLLEVLSETLLGGLADLHALLRRERPLAGPGVPEAGVRAAVDAVTVAWAGRARGVELGELALLRAPWQQALSPVPVALPADGYGGSAAALRELLDQVSRADAAAWDRVQQAHLARQGGLMWSEAMHEACRAAADTGRLVDVARAQLAAARAVRLAGVSATSAAQGATMAVMAAVQATCVLDVLEPSCARTLLEGWEAARA